VTSLAKTYGAARATLFMHTDDHQKGNTRVTHIKNYGFDFDFNQGWGTTAVVMTCVVGHLTNLDFPQDYKNWQFPPPDRLFTAPVNTIVQPVSE
jgi:DNA topoisomerase-3